MLDNTESGFETTQRIYLDSLNRYVKDLVNELEYISNGLAKQKSFINSVENRKAELTMELERVKQKIAEVSKAKDLSDLNMDGVISTHNSQKLSEIDEKSDEIRQEVQQLEEEYKKTTDSTERMIIQSKIQYKEQELRKLYKKSLKIGKRQRSIIIAKNRLDKLKSRGMMKQQAKVAEAETKAEVIQDRIDASKNSDNIVSTMVEKVREARVSYYRHKAQKGREVLDKMDGKSFIKGARAIAIAKVKAEKLRERMNARENAQDMVNTADVSVEQGQAVLKM